MLRNSCLLILPALVTIIAVGCSVVSNPPIPNAAVPSPSASGPPAPDPQPGVNWSTNPSLGPQFYV